MSATIIDLARFRARLRKNFKGEKRVPGDKRYVKFPTSFVDFISGVPMTPQHLMMVAAAIRNCHGFHNPDRSFDLHNLKQWLERVNRGQIRWHRRTVYKTAEELVDRGIFWVDKCGNTPHLTGSKYRIQNDSQKWKTTWKRGAVDKSVGNRVNNPVDSQLALDQLRQIEQLLAAPRRTYEQIQAELFSVSSEAKEPSENGFEPRRPPNLLEMSGFLKKSLKKIKESSSPESDLRKRKVEIFKKNGAGRSLDRYRAFCACSEQKR